MIKKTICFIAIIALFIPVLSTAEESFNLYGSVRLSTFYIDKSGDPDERDTSSTIWELQNNSRIGGTYKNSDIKAGFEFGDGHDGIEIRKLFGSYDMADKLTLKIGKDYTPLNYFPSNQVVPIYENEGDSGLKPYGGIYEGFETMIQVSTDRLKIAFIEPATVGETQLLYGVTGEIEKTLPKAEIAFNIGSEDKYIDLYTGYQTYRIVEDLTEAEYDINSWIIGINYGLYFGPAYILGNAYSGQNINPYGLWAEGDDSPRIISGDIFDCTTDGYIIVFGFKMADNAIIETGAGYITHSVDGAVQEDETFSGYVNLQYQFNSYFHFVPEIGIVDYMEDNAGADEGKKVYIGAKWQIDF